MFPEPFCQLLIGDIGALQFCLKEAFRALDQFPFLRRDVHALSNAEFVYRITYSSTFRLTGTLHIRHCIDGYINICSLSSRAKTLMLASVARMSDEEAKTIFRKIRWASNRGDPFCPKCGCTIVYDCRRAYGTARWRCKTCRHSFSITSGTLFHPRKMPLRAYLLAIAIFCNKVKGKSMLAMSRDLGTHYMTAFVLAHKMRETMASEVKAPASVGGDGKQAEIDGPICGGYVKPANRHENRRDRRLTEYRSGKRQCVVVIRERDGLTLPGVYRFIRRGIGKGTIVHADESSAWNPLHGRFVLKRINHEEAYSLMALA